MAVREPVWDSLHRAEEAWEQDDIQTASAEYAAVATMLAAQAADAPLGGDECLIALRVATRRAEIAGLTDEEGSAVPRLLAEAVAHWDDARAALPGDATGLLLERIARLGALATIMGADVVLADCFRRAEELQLVMPPAPVVIELAESDPEHARDLLHQHRAGRWFLASSRLSQGQNGEALDHLDQLVSLQEGLEHHPALADDPLFEPMATASLMGRYLRVAVIAHEAPGTCHGRHDRLVRALAEGYAEASAAGEDTTAAVAIHLMINAVELAVPCGRAEAAHQLIDTVRGWVEEQCAAQNLATVSTAADLLGRLDELAASC